MDLNAPRFGKIWIDIHIQEGACEVGQQNGGGFGGSFHFGLGVTVGLEAGCQNLRKHTQTSLDN